MILTLLYKDLVGGFPFGRGFYSKLYIISQNIFCIYFRKLLYGKNFLLIKLKIVTKKQQMHF